MKLYRVEEPGASAGPDTLDISIKGWRDSYTRKIRVYLVNRGEEVVVVTPGRGGTFALSYNYKLQFSSRGIGAKGIERMMYDSRGGCDEWTRYPAYAEIIARAIDYCRKRLLKAREERQGETK